MMVKGVKGGQGWSKVPRMVKDGQRCQGWSKVPRMVKGAKDGQGWSKVSRMVKDGQRCQGWSTIVKDGQVSRCQSRWSVLSSTRNMEKQFQGCSDDGPHWSEKSSPNEINIDFETLNPWQDRIFFHNEPISEP